MKDKNEFAKESVVEDYLADLLTETANNLDFDKASTQKLLDKAGEDSQKPTDSATVHVDNDVESVVLAAETKKYILKRR